MFLSMSAMNSQHELFNSSMDIMKTTALQNVVPLKLKQKFHQVASINCNCM